MKIGVYIDGYNLYYGARGICGRSTSGWRWLDLRALASRLATKYASWDAPLEFRVIYCTARINGSSNPSGQRDQDVYLRAISGHGSIDLIEFGNYVSRVATSPLETADRKGRPILTKSNWPIMIQNSESNPVTEATFMASVARREEKGSDVNVGTHLLFDVLTGDVDGAIVISNDSDLRLPVQLARERVPLGLVNPTKGYPAGALSADPEVGVGGHWWCKLQPDDLVNSQLPPVVGRTHKPTDW